MTIVVRCRKALWQSDGSSEEERPQSGRDGLPDRGYRRSEWNDGCNVEPQGFEKLGVELVEF
jgi:hypothetical protein